MSIDKCLCRLTSRKTIQILPFCTINRGSPVLLLFYVYDLNTQLLCLASTASNLEMKNLLVVTWKHWSMEQISRLRELAFLVTPQKWHSSCRLKWEVDVISAYPSYPTWEKVTGYNYWTFSSETINGIRINRIPTFIPKTNDYPKVHFWVFVLPFSLPILIKLGRSCDVCIVTTPPFIIGLGQVCPKRLLSKYHCKRFTGGHC